MKTLKWIVCGTLLLAASFTKAQVSVNVNIGAPPAWGPVGYTEAEYYYLPEIATYYDVRSSQFIYFGDGRWVRVHDLPPRYRGYDLYHGRTVILTDYHGREPYVYYKKHKAKYYGPTKFKHDNGNHGHRNHGNGKGNGHGHGKGHNK